MRVRVAGMVIENGKLLVLKYQYPKGPVHALPGGNIETGEFAPQTLKREFLEELSLEVAVGKLIYVGEMLAQEKIGQTLHLVFQATIESGSPRLNPEQTSAQEHMWLELGEIDRYCLYPDLGETTLTHCPEDASAKYLGNVMHRQWV